MSNAAAAVTAAPAPTPPIHLNADFSERVVSHAADATWISSPAAGVERRMLDRIGGEVARATSVVRYLPGSKFSSHVHGGGEEFIVLEGVFSDERGDYPAGTYVRNPPGSAHAPFSREGCTIFVKLWQYAEGDSQDVRIDTRSKKLKPGLIPGLSGLRLHTHGDIETFLVRWAPNTRFDAHVHPGGEEIFVLEGVFRDELGAYPQGSWLRNPSGAGHHPFTEGEGALIYVKTGHIGAKFLTLP
jgi:anti-sigma factor ChrR (cupin superfamily)